MIFTYIAVFFKEQKMKFFDVGNNAERQWSTFCVLALSAFSAPGFPSARGSFGHLMLMGAGDSGQRGGVDVKNSMMELN